MSVVLVVEWEETSGPKLGYESPTSLASTQVVGSELPTRPEKMASVKRETEPELLSSPELMSEPELPSPDSDRGRRHPTANTKCSPHFKRFFFQKRMKFVPNQAIFVKFQYLYNY